MKKSKPLVEEAQAYRYALWLLNRRPYSTGEILEKFQKRELPTDLQKKVLQRLLDKKFLNDAAFAETFIHSRMGRSWGPYKIKLGLQKKKIPRQLGDKTLSSMFTPETEKGNALNLLERQKQRFLRQKEKKPGQTLQRACEFLLRKGYSYPAARLAVKKVFGYNSDLPTED